MSQTLKQVAAFDMAIFGGTGDLALRKLLPALLRRFHDGQIPTSSRIIGIARADFTTASYRDWVAQKLSRIVAEDDTLKTTLPNFLSLLHYCQLDATRAAGWQEFAQTMRTTGTSHVWVFYLSTSPDLFVDFCDKLEAYELNQRHARLVIEKPIGRDLTTAQTINKAISRVFAEDQIFRIDHYLGKETVQNLIALRFGNALFEPLWNSAHIDHIQITVAETVGVGTRAGYYDQAGALRDMVQNHLLQLLCMVAMEPPVSLSATAVRDEKLKVLHALKPITTDTVDQLTVRGQYRQGADRDGAVTGYLDDIEQAESATETFVALKAGVDNWRWAGVPFYLRTGKRLPVRRSEIVVTFKQVPYSIFGNYGQSPTPNKLVLRLQPNEGVKLWLMVKYPGPGGLRLTHTALDMSFAEAFNIHQPDAYERLLLDVVQGNPTLFMRRDEVEAAWKWVTPILDAWQKGNSKPSGYIAGTWGPSAAVGLIERDGRSWHDEDIAS